MVLEVSSKEKIKSLKLEFPKTVILIKVGIFYHAYNSDAGVLSYIMNYKFIKDSCGFAQNSLEKVITEFSKCKVNVYVDNLYGLMDNLIRSSVNVGNIRSKYLKEMLVNIYLLDLYIGISLEKKIIKKKRFNSFVNSLNELKKMINSWSMNEKKK